MGRLGMIVRADMGGLGNLTKSLWRHLQPDVTMVVELPDPRGKSEPTLFAGHDFRCQHPIGTGAFRDLCRRIGPGGTLLTVETMYCDDAYRIAREEGVRTIMYAMPELFDSRNDRADVVVVPTPWELRRMPADVMVLAMPTDSAPNVRIRTECTTFLHHVAPAMLDRSGTEIVRKAFGMMMERATLIMHTPGALGDVQSLTDGRGHVTMFDRRWHDNLWDSYPLDADVMVLPRRYGGLSMPTQEAASTGLPSIMPALDPQRWWGGIAYTMIDGADVVPMKGGQYAVHNPSPEDLAYEMDSFVRGEHDVHGLSEDALHWARSISWSNMLEDWVQLCRG